jgi:ABC-type glycerol-3-phosphate transport system permease component
MVVTAMNGDANAGSRTLWPDEWTLENFTYVIGEGGFGRYLTNSLVVALGTVLAGAPCSRYWPPWLSPGSASGSARQYSWPGTSSSSTLITIPVMVFFVIAQKRLTDGLVAGAVKG